MSDSRLRYANDRVAEELKEMPEKVRDVFMFALAAADRGLKHQKAKPMKGLGSGVMEISERHDKNAYRLVYTTENPDFVLVVHCFQKKSMTGTKTPDREINTIKRRLKVFRGQRSR